MFKFLLAYPRSAVAVDAAFSLVFLWVLSSFMSDLTVGFLAAYWLVAVSVSLLLADAFALLKGFEAVWGGLRKGLSRERRAA